MDDLLERHRSTSNYYLRLRAAVTAGETDVAWAGIDHLAKPRTLRNARLARSLRVLMHELGPPPERWQLTARRVGAAARAR